jgi:hypothetical protein
LLVFLCPDPPIFFVAPQISSSDQVMRTEHNAPARTREGFFLINVFFITYFSPISLVRFPVSAINPAAWTSYAERTEFEKFIVNIRLAAIAEAVRYDQ